MTNKLKCKLNIISNSAHTSAVVTGYMMLQKNGEIDLEINRIIDKKKYPNEHMVEVILNEKIVLAYDLLDGYNWEEEKVVNYLEKCDFYFKRSFDNKLHKYLHYNYKIYPLGLNYHVTIESNPIDKKNIKNKIRRVLKCILKKQVDNHASNFYVEKFEDKPKKVENSPKVLFYTRLWSPFGEADESINLKSNLVEERKYINQTRVEIIRGLRERLGENFTGGLAPTAYAVENFSDYIISYKDSDRVNYLESVKKSDICIANMGLHKSTGWKFAEYIAASKAIVSEKLYYQVPNGFSEGINYLEFKDSKECISKVMELVNNHEKLYKMKEENYNYYLNHLRPDKQIMDTLRIATSGKD